MEIMKCIYDKCSVEDGKYYLKCTVAFQIANELKINVSEVGKMCNEKGIKIKSCQIGCF